MDKVQGPIPGARKVLPHLSDRHHPLLGIHGIQIIAANRQIDQKQPADRDSEKRQ